jgi:hypothetical protein
VTDVKSSAVNEDLTVRHNFIITGSKLAISGNPSICGLFRIVIGAGGTETPLKIEEPFIENSRK